MRKARALGESLGYEVEQAPHTKYTGDYFSHFDHMWLKGERLIFVQIKTNQSITKKMQEDFYDWSYEHLQEVMIMNWQDKKKEWQIFRYETETKNLSYGGRVKIVFSSKNIT